MRREIIVPDGRAPSPLWVRVRGEKPGDWQERLLAHLCAAGAGEMLIEREHDSREPCDARDAYLRRVLVTLRKLGLTVERWLDGLDVLGEAEPDPLWRRALADEQMARQRLACEMLLELIGFGLTDQPPHYEHHQLLLEFQRLGSRLADLRDFHSCEPASLIAEVRDAAAAVGEVEGRPDLDLSRCWYARRRRPMPPDAIAKTPAGQITSSQRMRLQELLAHAAPTERLMLGISYDRLYSRLSRAVHFSTEASPEGPDAVLGHGGGDVSVEGLRFGTVVVARLGVQCLNRLLAQAGIAGGAACQLQRETLASQREDPHSTVLHDLVDGGVRIGDFALVHERLAEVAERAENQFGHVRYRVTYVAERPRNDVAEEWWPASEVHTLFERTQVKGWFAELLAAAPPKQREDFERAGLAAFAGEAWRQSLRDEVLEKLA